MDQPPSLRSLAWRALRAGAVVALLAGCGSSPPPQPYHQYLASWKGKSEQELVIAFGIPDNTHVLAGNSRVLEYVDGAARCTTRFTVDAGGRISGWWYKGTECRAPDAS